MIGRTVSHYKILERVGAGGMGVVYKGQDTRLNRPVALKFLPAHLQNDEHHTRFLHEARAASALDHPNICTIYEIGETEDRQLFIAMAYYEGETLREKIERAPLTVEQTLEIGIQILQGLSKAHELGIVHRDIKPANIVVTKDSLVKILDFGLAKLSTGARITRSGTALGTLAYMSPEQMRGENVDHRSDLWSTGIMLYECLTGKLPFQAPSEHALFHAVLNEEPVPARNSCPDLPRELESVLRNAMEKTPAMRYGSAREMLKDLESVKVSSRPTMSVQTPASFDRKPAAAQRSGEKRQVTIVVSHLSGYAELIEHLSPHEMERLLDQIQHSAGDVVQNHRGILNQFSGERIVCLFGIPAAHEDDCVQAIRATMELHSMVQRLGEEIEERTGEPLRLHSGVGTGLVVTEALSDGEPYRVTGSPVQFASNLATQAGSDEIRISSECRRPLSPYFEIQACDSVLIQGKKQSSFRIIGESGMQSRLEAAEKAGFTPLTGRENELNILRNAADKTQANEGQFITIVGEAGIGKSRLLFEFRAELENRDFRVTMARCDAHSSNISYLPFIQALRMLLQLNQNHEDAVPRILSLNEDLRTFLPIYLDLLSIKKDEYPLPEFLQGEDLQLAIREALSAIFTITAGNKPLAFLLEDWHWADDDSKEVLKQLAEISAAYPMLLLVTYRPEMPVQVGTLSNRISLYLGPLDADLSVDFLRSFLSVDDFPEDLGKIIHDRTGGNPFFLEEVCYALLDDGKIQIQKRRAHFAGQLDQIRLPENVEAVIRSRLDKLDHSEQEVLRLASVIGREFSRSVIQKMAADISPAESLQKLKTFGLIQQISILPEAVYRFKHALTQHVSYESLLHHRRKSLHGLAGRAIEEMYSERLDEFVNLLAFHFGQSEEWKTAIRYANLAAQRAEKLGRFSEALEWLEKSYGWLLKLPDDADRHSMLIENLFRQERMAETLGERERQWRAIEDLLSRVQVSGDRIKIAEVYVRQGDLFTLTGRFGAAEEALQKAIQICKEGANLAAERNALRSLGFLRWHQGNNQEAVAINENVLSMDRQIGDKRSIAGDLINLGNALRHLGDHKRALESLEEALKIYEEHPDPNKNASTFHIMANIYRDLGENDRALECLRRASDLSTKNQLFVQLPFHLMSIGNIYLQQGKIDESLKLHREALELNQRIKHADGLAQSNRIVGEILSSLHRESEALTHLQAAGDLFAQLSDATAEMQMRKNVGTIQEQLGQFSAAVGSWEQVLHLGKELSDGNSRLEALEAMARLSRLAGNSEDIVLHYYRQALNLAQENNNTLKSASILNSMGILEWNRGRYENALVHYESALGMFEEMEDPVHEGLMRNSVGATLLRLGREEEALLHLQQGLDCNRRTNQQLLEAHTLALLGDYRKKKQDLRGAVDYYEGSLRLRRAKGDRRGEGWMLYHLASLYGSMQMPEESEAYADEAKNIAAACGDEKLLDLLKKI